MYAKIFSQVFNSSIADNWKHRIVFQDLLILADQDGMVDMTAEAISCHTRLPLSMVVEAIKALSDPDPRSRTKEFEGRRIVPIDPERGWGWAIVNYAKYRNLKSDTDRTEYMREYMRKKRGCKQEIVNKSLPPANSASVSASVSDPEGGVQRGKVDWAVQIYDAYPRKVSRKEGVKAIMKAIDQGTEPEALLDLTKKYSQAVAKWPEDEKRFVPHPSTWFNQERFKDDPITWKREAPKPEVTKPRTFIAGIHAGNL